MKKIMKTGLLLTSFLLLSCSSNSLSGESYSFPPFSYSNEEPIPAETYVFSNEDGLALDGTYKAQYGESVYRLYHKNDESSPFYSDLYVYYGKRGVHIYVSVKDNIVNYVPQKAVYYNSSVEIFINDISKNYIDNHSVQWRVAAGGKAVKLCGVRYRSTWTVSQFDGSFATHVDGELNTNGAKGYGIETFTPYYELGIKEENVASLQGLNIYLAMNRVPTTSTDQNLTFRQRTYKELSFQATPTTWVPVYKKEDLSGKNGFPVSDFYGRCHAIDTSLGFRFEKEGEEEHGYLEKTIAVNYAMAKEGYDPLHYYYECRIKNIVGASSARIGLFTYLSGNRFTLYLEKGNKARAGLVQRNATNASWNWNIGEGEHYINDFSDPSKLDFLNAKGGTKLALYRSENTYGFFVNDELYYATADLRVGETSFAPQKTVILNHAVSEIDGLYEDAFVGIYSYSAKAEFYDYGIYSGEEAESKIATLLKQ